MVRKPFSVSMCVYRNDNPEHFRMAVDSILNQTVLPDEVVLVVDGPVPTELEFIIKEYEKRNIFRIIWLSENQGHGNARRLGLLNCRYDLVALMDADDISVPDRFEKQLTMFNNNHELTIVGGNIEEFINDPVNVVGIRRVPTTDAEIKRYMKKRCPMNQITVMFKKASVMAVGGYIDWYCEEDYYLWARLMLGGYKFANLDDVLCKVRVGTEMYQRRGGWKYFISETRMQCFMLQANIISHRIFIINVLKRLFVQIILPNRLRGFFFQQFARENFRK